MLAQLVEKYPDEVQVVFRHFPLPSHTLALLSAQATEAAGLQSKFWEMHDVIFAEQQTWAAMTEDQFSTWLSDQAKALGLNVDQFNQDLTSEPVVSKVKQAQDHGVSIGIPGTPFTLINGQVYQGPRDLENLELILNMFKLEDRQFTYCPPMVIDPQKQYTATLKTEKGDIVIDLYPDKAPLTVNSFVFLAQQNWFDDVTFHRVLEGFVAQTGDPSGSGMGGPGYSFKDEISDLKFDKPGVLGMANAGQNSNGSQFFITFAPIPNLDGKYTVFGQVTEGMDVLNSLTVRDPASQMGIPPGDKILDVEIEEK